MEKEPENGTHTNQDTRVDAPKIEDSLTSYLWYHVRKDWPVLKKAPIASFSIFLLGVCFSTTFFWFLTSEILLPAKQGQIDLWKSKYDADESDLAKLRTISPSLNNVAGLETKVDEMDKQIAKAPELVLMYDNEPLGPSTIVETSARSTTSAVMRGIVVYNKGQKTAVPIDLRITFAGSFSVPPTDEAMPWRNSSETEHEFIGWVYEKYIMPNSQLKIPQLIIDVNGEKSDSLNKKYPFQLRVRCQDYEIETNFQVRINLVGK